MTSRPRKLANMQSSKRLVCPSHFQFFVYYLLSKKPSNQVYFSFSELGKKRDIISQWRQGEGESIIRVEGTAQNNSLLQRGLSVSCPRVLSLKEALKMTHFMHFLPKVYIKRTQKEYLYEHQWNSGEITGLQSSLRYNRFLSHFLHHRVKLFSVLSPHHMWKNV